MGEITKKENEWADRATAAAIAGARKIALNSSGLPMMTPIGRLTDVQWGWVMTAGVFAWIRTRCEQAIDEGQDQESTVRHTGLSPSPCDVAVVQSILPKLGETAGVDWNEPLKAWSKDTMTNFLLLAWQLITKAEDACDRGSRIIRKIPDDLSIPGFLRRDAEPKENSGDVPFDRGS